jgi:hypothetical protein
VGAVQLKEAVVVVTAVLEREVGTPGAPEEINKLEVLC